MLLRLPLSASSLLFALLATTLPAQDVREQPKADAPKIDVPAFPNATCPIMGKKVSMPLFVDTELGRIWLCCKPCNKKVLADVATAHKTAYPVVQEVKNTTCPVSGEPIGEHAVTVTLQGYRFAVCCQACVATAQQHSQVSLLKLTQPNVRDVGNTTCPVSGTPVTANAFVRIGDAIVHLSASKLVEDVAKDPAAALAKAEAIAKAQPPRPKHVHGTTAAPKDASTGKASDGKPESGK